MNKKFIFFIFLLLAPLTFAYDPSLITDKYTYSVNESIFAVGSVKINVTAISNVSVVFTVRDVSDAAVSTATFVTNSSGQFNSTFSLTSAGNYTLVANVSGDVVKHFIKIKSYAKISLSLSRPSYTSGAAGTATISVADINGGGVSGQGVTSSIRYSNGTVLSSLSACTTDSLGQCTTNFTAPSADGSYILEANNFENSVALVVGGYDAFMKISPSIVGKNQNVTVKVIVKNSNGNGITASTRQVLVTAPNGTQTTLTSMTPANDSSGASVTGVYEDMLSFDAEGTYEVKVTIQPQGSNLTRELKGGFTVSSYLLEFIPWAGLTTLFTPGETVSLGVRLRNGSSNEFMKTTQCGSGSCTTSLGAATVLDPSGIATGYEISVSEKTSLNLYRMDLTLPSNAKSGTYKVKVSLNDSFGTGSGDGYFNVQFAKAKMRALDKFPGGISKETFLPGKQVVLEFAVTNASGAVNITGISSYSIRDTSGNDKTSIFGTGVTYSANNNKSYVNITAPNKGGRYIAKAKLNTLLGTVDAEGSVFVDVLEIEIRPQAIGGGTGGGFTPFGGPGYMFAFRPNDTINLQVTLKTASEKRGSEGFMGGGLGKGGSAAGGHSVGVGGMFGIGGGSAIQGGQVIIDRIINLNTEEDATSSTTITNCITDSTGICTLSVKSNVNGQNWTGGFYIMFVNVTTSDNQTDNGQGFFEVRRYMVNVQTRAATAKSATSSGFTSFNDWFVGPDDNINISIRIIEPGTWQAVSLNGNATIQGIYYAGTIGEFIFPPKLQSGTTATANITNSVASAVIAAPSGGWKSGSYIVKVTANVSGVLDTGDSFLMVKIYQGFGQPINPATNQMDFTVNSNENASIRINVFDVRNNRPAANLTVTLGKILSFESFPPNEITYDKSNVTTGTTDSNGQVVMALSAPSGGWSTGNFLTNFDVTNGTVSDSIQGFFQVKNFFAELSPAKWRFATNETVAFNATISSDPSWMRQQFGGGCPAGDPMCGGGGGGAPAPIPTPVIVNHTFVGFGNATDLDGDGQKDINITASAPGTPNLTVMNGTGSARTGIAANFWCMTPSQCQASPAPLSASYGLDSVDCDAAGTYSNKTTHNMSGPAFFCVNASSGALFKVQTEAGGTSGMSIGYLKHVAGSVGGIAPPNLTGTQGFSYYNATLKSVKVVKFDFSTGETLLRQNIDYNLTSATGSTIGDGKIVIPGVGTFKLVPIAASGWASGFYRVIAEFNISATSSETAESGFSVETFFANCYRNTWGAVASGTNITIRCDVTDPGSGGNYASRVDMQVESVRNVFTFQTVTGWSSTRNFTDATKSTANILFDQSLGNGQYEATIKLNASSSDVKRQSVWFEIKDFDPVFYSERWSYASADNVTLRIQGLSGNLYLPVNLSFTGGSPEIVVYRYDKSTGSKSTVSGINISITNSSDQFWPFNATLVNLTKSGGWDEGSYEVMANVTRMNAARTSATGGKVEVRTWFEVRLFNVWGWSESWSNHPKSNVTLRVHVGVAGNWWQFYNGNVNATITAVTNTQTGAVLTRGTDYTATNAIANPSSVGNLNLSIIPVTSLPVGQYRATVKVTDCNPGCSSGKSMATDVWFDVKAFQLYISAGRYEYASTDDVDIFLSAYSPGAGSFNLTDARITYLSKCTSTTCTTVNLTTLNTVFSNTGGNKLRILSTSGLATGWYWANILVNDTQNATDTGGAGFQIKGFGASGYVQKPSPSRYYYYINETMLLNVTATPGTNITHATFKYWDCSTGTCLQIPLIVNISQNVTAQNILVNMTPTGLNNTWPTGRWGYREYTIDVSARKDSDTSTFTASGVYVQFAGPWNITGPSSVAPSDNITINMTIYVADITNATQGQLRLANAIINVSNVWSATTAGYNDMNTTPGLWNHTGNITDANGLGQAIIKPDINRFNWTSGNIVVFMTIKYGNASTYVYYYTTVAQKTLNILGKNIKLNNTILSTAPTCASNCTYNLTVRVSNPQSVDANQTTITVTTSRLNSTASVNAQSATTLSGISIPAGAAPTYNFTYNVTGITNITHVIQFTPTTGGFAAMSTTYTYASAVS